VTGRGNGPAQWWRRHFLDGTHFHVQGFGFDPQKATLGGLAQINIAIDVLTVDISRPAETELDLLDQKQCAAYRPPVASAAARDLESYLRVSALRSTKP
jgi:hypothetical protein